MNGQNEAVYNQHCQPQLEGAFSAMVEFLKAASGVIPSVTATAIEGLEGVDIDACKAQADACGVAFRKRSLDIVG
jgi:hypothetical protein